MNIRERIVAAVRPVATSGAGGDLDAEDACDEVCAEVAEWLRERGDRFAGRDGWTMGEIRDMADEIDPPKETP